MTNEPERPPEHNQIGLDYRRPMPRPPVRGRIIDAHLHVIAHRHCETLFESADHFGFDHFVTQTPLEEALVMQRDFGDRFTFVAIPSWQTLAEPDKYDRWARRIEAFHNLGSRMAKFHMAPGTMSRARYRLDDPGLRRIMEMVRDRGMIIMSHIGDPDIWYSGKYADPSVWGNRDEHYRLFEQALEDFRGTPWWCAHLGGNPENLTRIQGLLDRFPDLLLDLSATRWMVREISKRRDEARAFVLKNQDRLIWGSDQVTGDTRDYDFLSSRYWCHRKLFETAHQGQTPILDPDLPTDAQPTLRGLALPDTVLQKLYRDNCIAMFRKVGVEIA